MFSSRSEIAVRAKTGQETGRLVKFNGTAAGETQIQPRAIRRRPHIAIVKTNYRNRPRKGSFCNSALEDVAREHTCPDCLRQIDTDNSCRPCVLREAIRIVPACDPFRVLICFLIATCFLIRSGEIEISALRKIV